MPVLRGTDRQSRYAYLIPCGGRTRKPFLIGYGIPKTAELAILLRVSPDASYVVRLRYVGEMFTVNLYTSVIDV